MMNISSLLNPSTAADMLSPPLSPNQLYSSIPSSPSSSFSSSSMDGSTQGKPRSRFSDLEDAIICEGVANGLTWGQISNQLPHRKRATCFNRYRTLQGIRKSRKRSSPLVLAPSSLFSSSSSHASITPRLSHTPLSAVTPVLSPTWTPTSPPSDFILSSYPVYSSTNYHDQHQDPLIRRLSSSSSKDYDDDATLPPICYPIPHYPKPKRSSFVPYLI